MWPRGPASPQRRTRRPLLQLLSPGAPTSQQNTRTRVVAWRMQVGLHRACLTDCLSPRGGRQFCANAGRTTSGTPGVRILSWETSVAMSCLSCRAFFEMPCCECRWNYRLLISWSRVRVPPVPNQGDRSSVGRARRFTIPCRGRASPLISGALAQKGAPLPKMIDMPAAWVTPGAAGKLVGEHG